jgi:uncharacterized membrane protein
MREQRGSFFQTILRNERGQMLPIVAFMMVVLLGFTGLVVDVGHAYVGYRQLQSSTDAAALAAVQSLPNNTTATAVATAYGAASGAHNAVTMLSNPQMMTGYPQYKCLTSLGVPCIAPANANAIVVKQTGTVHMTFGAVVGFKTMTLTATSTAALSGGVTPPYNVAIVLDTTASMQDKDNDPSCNASRISCALNGVQILL